MRQVNAVLTIAYRDLLKFLRDRARLVSTFIFPFIFIFILGGSLQGSMGEMAGYNFVTFTFTGVLAQTLFQSSSMGIVSLIDDRENDFSQEIFVSPISRYAIIFGKILGESLVAMVQALGIILFGLVIGVPITLPQVFALLPVGIAICLFGGAFGIIILSNLNNRRTADQIFPFIMLPQFFLAGIFSPIKNLPPFVDILSRISPMRYAVDLTRSIFYLGTDDYSKVVLANPVFNLAIMAILFVIFMFIGTTFFVRNERNR
jgi:ABC-2 type transport system permease protein